MFNLAAYLQPPTFDPSKVKLNQYADLTLGDANPDFTYGDVNHPNVQPGWSQAFNDLMAQTGGNDSMNSGYTHVSQLFQQPGFADKFFSMYPGSQNDVNSLLKFGNVQSRGLDNGYGSFADIAPLVFAIVGGGLAGAAGGAGADAASAIPASEAGVGTGSLAGGGGALASGAASQGGGALSGGFNPYDAEDATAGQGMFQGATNAGYNLGNPILRTGPYWQGDTFLPGNWNAVPYGAPGDASGAATRMPPADTSGTKPPPPDATPKAMSPMDLAKLGLSALPSGGGMMGGYPALQMGPASLFTPVMPGALYPFGR